MAPEPGPGYRHRLTTNDKLCVWQTNVYRKKKYENFVVPTLLLEIPGGSCQLQTSQLVDVDRAIQVVPSNWKIPSNQRIRQSLIWINDSASGWKAVLTKLLDFRDYRGLILIPISNCRARITQGPEGSDSLNWNAEITLPPVARVRTWFVENEVCTYVDTYGVQSSWVFRDHSSTHLFLVSANPLTTCWYPPRSPSRRILSSWIWRSILCISASLSWGRCRYLPEVGDCRTLAETSREIDQVSIVAARTLVDTFLAASKTWNWMILWIWSKFFPCLNDQVQQPRHIDENATHLLHITDEFLKT